MPSSILALGPVKVYSFRELLQKNAEIVSRNPRHSIFYRGQPRQYFDGDGNVTILPSIYRGATSRQKKKMEARFESLDDVVKQLRKALKDDIDPKFLRTVNCWAIIQHYELYGTPLIDVTQSLRIACAFALNDDDDAVDGNGPVVYDVALPFATGPLTLDDNEALYLMKLDSLMPSLMLRPFVQESYLVGDELIAKSADDIAGADLKRRVIASFRLCGDKETWLKEIGFDAETLMIRDDDFADLKREISLATDKPRRTDAEREGVTDNISKMLLQFADVLKASATYSD